MSLSSYFRIVLILETKLVRVLLYDIPKTVFLLNNSLSRRILVQRFSYCIYRSRSRHGTARHGTRCLPRKRRRGNFSEQSTLSSFRLNPGKDRNLLYRILNGPRDRSEKVLKVLRPPGIDPRTLLRVTSCSKDCEISVAYNIYKLKNIAELSYVVQYSSTKCRYLQLTVVIICQKVVD